MDSGQSPTDKEILREVSGQIAVEESSPRRRGGTLLNNVKRPCYGTSWKMMLQQKENIGDENENANQTIRNSKEDMNEESLIEVELRYDVDNFKSRDSPYSHNEKDAGRGYTSDTGTTSVDTSSTANEGGDHRGTDIEASDNKWSSCSSLSNAEEKCAHATVKETIRTSNRFYLQLVQQKNDSSKEQVVKESMQLDLEVLSKMYATNSIMCPRKRFGHLPGIDVGYQFHSRAELVALGFHSDGLNAIDCIGEAHGETEEYKNHTFPFAVAILLSVEDEDDPHNLDDIIYTTTLCEYNHKVKHHQVQNPFLSYGNQALKNNLDQSIPIRIASYYDEVYTYDGLYMVTECWAHKDHSGCLVYKTRLRRVEGQPKLKINQGYFNKENSSGSCRKSPGVLSLDITGGQEEIPIPLLNLVDKTPSALTGFTYSKSIQVAEGVNIPCNADGCKCKGQCRNSKYCACARLNGSKFPYVRCNGGRLTRARDVLFECGPNCGCGPDCINRISQRGIKYHLEVFRTPDKGWAVRTRDFIPAGAPVCEYVGVLKRTDELDNVEDNEYIFEIDCLHTMKGVEGREKRLGAVSAPIRNHLEKIDDRYLEETPEFCIDASSIGNVARFINHSCKPNLFVQCVLSAHRDARLARVFLFASDRIAPFEELTYDYGCLLDSVIGSDGKVKQQPCYCGAPNCRKRMY